LIQQTPIARRTLLGAGAAAAALPRRSHAAEKPIRIGVLSDMTGPYAANTGPGSVLGAQMAVEDFSRAHPGIKAELVQADFQLKPDVALAIATDWFDNKGVDLITDVPLSSAAFALSDLAKAKDKVAIFTGAASADITGTRCGPNHLHWVHDTWSMSHGVASLFGRGDAARRKLPMSAEDLLEAEVLIYLRGLGFSTDRRPAGQKEQADQKPPPLPTGPWGTPK